MIKDCRVILNNNSVTVVKFGEEEVQLPAIRTDEKTVRVAFENGKYKVVGKDYVEKAEKKIEKLKEDKPEKVEDKPEKAEETTEKKIEKKENGSKPFQKK